MRRAGSRALWIKLAILGLVVWFVSTRVDLGDRLVLREQPAAPAKPDDGGSEAALEIPIRTLSGEVLMLATGESLPIEVLAPEGRPLEIWILQEGERIELDPDLVRHGGPFAIRPGLISTMRSIDPLVLLSAVLAFAPVPLLVAVRWFLLLRAVGVTIGWAATARLTWIGLFFNTVLPGGAGGDVVKLIEIGRHSDRRSEALGTMIADRVVGLLVLIVLGGAAMLLLRQDTGGLAAVVLAVGVALVLGGGIYLSPFLRSRIDVGGLLARLPLGGQLRRVDDAFVALRGAPGALASAAGLSVVAQLANMGAAVQCAHALGLGAVNLLDMLRTVPVALVANAIPISPGGLGLLEVAFQELLYRQGLSSLAQGFMVGVLLRVISVAWSLPGLPLWLFATRRVSAGEHGEAARPMKVAGS
ncbi:MAG TPA: lysylphosphatidylglycerol synthase transmembrane domain-containing protein [Thermoanaerobaculia bacterium]|nr:lysylphosphatidylglycerol synthase transmembrane domain-containing protein [Thermoanaerobaculia bacterium]